MNKLKNKYLLIPLFTAILSLVVLVSLHIFSKNTQKSYVDFINDLSAKKVSTVYVTNAPTIKVQLKDGKSYDTDNPRTDQFKENLLKDGVKVSENVSGAAADMIPTTTLIISVVVLLAMLLRSSSITSKGMLNATSMELAAVENIGFTLQDVAGNEEAKESVSDVIDFLKHPDKYSAYGARMPKGIILYGEPGTGKTLLAKAIAGEANVPFYALSGSDFVQVYVGVGASRIRNLFKKARSHGKAVIFIDEIDAIGKHRDNNKAGGSDERDQTLNALLTEMSGFNEKEGIVVMAATNRLDMLDPALLRPGRFDRHIEINLPDVSAREKILSLHLKNKPAQNINVAEWAQKTAYFSGAKIESLINESAILACKDGSPFIEDIHLDKAFSIVLAGYEKQNRDHIKEHDKKITAFHEIGHALVSLRVLPKEKVSKVTIIPSTKGAGGYTLSIPEDRMYQTKDYLQKRMMVLLAGRAAEELIFGQDFITTGAYNDLKQCTNTVTHMITEYGMGQSLGLLSFQNHSQLDGATRVEAIKEAKELVNTLYNEVKEILNREKHLLEKISYTLIDKETLYYEDLLHLLEM